MWRTDVNQDTEAGSEYPLYSRADLHRERLYYTFEALRYDMLNKYRQYWWSLKVHALGECEGVSVLESCRMSYGRTSYLFEPACVLEFVLNVRRLLRWLLSRGYAP